MILQQLIIGTGRNISPKKEDIAKTAETVKTVKKEIDLTNQEPPKANSF